MSAVSAASAVTSVRIRRSRILDVMHSGESLRGGAVHARAGVRPVDVAAGLPDDDVLPYARIGAAFADALRSHESLTYPSPYGLRPLREIIARRRGVPVESVIVTNGAMGGIFLSMMAVADPGDVVLAEDPSFPQWAGTFRRFGVHVEGVGLTDEGIDVDEVERRLAAGRRYAAIYTIPDFQNPTGRVSSGRVKRRLVEVADRYGVPVIADNPYRELWFSREPAEFPQEARGASGSPLLEIGSFSKWLGPGLRVGWLIADPALASRIAEYRLAVDGGVSAVTQAALVSMLSDERWTDDLLAHERRVYAGKAMALMGALEDRLDGDIDVVRPQGGYFLWARLPRWLRVEDDAVARELAVEGVNPLGGEAFFLAGGVRGRSCSGVHAAYARFSFAHASRDDLVEGAARLGSVARRLRPAGI